jgi:hypothetical protein
MKQLTAFWLCLALSICSCLLAMVLTAAPAQAKLPMTLQSAIAPDGSAIVDPKGQAIQYLDVDVSDLRFADLPPLQKKTCAGGRCYAAKTPAGLIVNLETLKQTGVQTLSLSSMNMRLGRAETADWPDLPLKSFKLVAEQTLEEWVTAVAPSLANVPATAVGIGQYQPFADLLRAKGYDPKLVLGTWVGKSAGRLKLAQLSQLSEYPLSSLKCMNAIEGCSFDIGRVPINQFVRWQAAHILEIPILGNQLPFRLWPNPPQPLNATAGRINTIYGSQSSSATDDSASQINIISGSDVSGFNAACAQAACPGVSLSFTATNRSTTEREVPYWISGEKAQVLGGDGTLASSAGQEPTGRILYSGGFWKHVLWSLDDARGTGSVAVFYRVCDPVAGCQNNRTPYLFPGGVWRTFRVDDYILVGLLDETQLMTALASQSTDPDQSSAKPFQSQKFSSCQSSRDSKPLEYAAAGLDLKILVQALEQIQPLGDAGYGHVGSYIQQASSSCKSRPLGYFRFLSCDEDVASVIQQTPDGQKFLEQLSQGYKPTSEELLQSYSPADQQRVAMRRLQRLSEYYTAKGLVGPKLIQAVGRGWFGGKNIKPELSEKDALGRSTVQAYGDLLLQNYQSLGGTIETAALACSSPATHTSNAANSPRTPPGNDQRRSQLAPGAKRSTNKPLLN